MSLYFWPRQRIDETKHGELQLLKMNTLDCRPCCTVTPPTQVPGVEGLPGEDGAPGIGTAGENAFTTTTSDFVVPAIGSDVIVAVESTNWMADGMNVVVDGPATFQAAINSSTQLTLTFLGYTNDVAPGSTILAGAKVTAAGNQPDLVNGESDGSGSDYSLTNAYANIAFGTDQIEVVLPSKGTYLVQSVLTLATPMASDKCLFKYRNSTDATDVTASEIEVDRGDSQDFLQAKLMSLITITAGPKTIQVWGLNTIQADGTVYAAYSKTTFVKVSNS